MNELQLFPDPVQPDRGTLELTQFDMVERRKRGRPVSRAAQTRLFDATKQDRNLRNEVDDVYYAVLALRAMGKHVYRMGKTQHIVNGSLVSVGQLKKMAEEA